MGLTYAAIEVENPVLGRSLKLRALVDSGSVFMTLPEHIAVQLGFDLANGRTREVTVADGRRRQHGIPRDDDPQRPQGRASG